MTEDLGANLDLLPEFDFVHKVQVALQRVERVAGGCAAGLVQPQLVHESVGGQAEQQQVVGIAQVPVVIHPLGQNLAAVGAQGLSHHHDSYSSRAMPCLSLVARTAACTASRQSSR